jgi:hypothetical protein
LVEPVPAARSASVIPDPLIRFTVPFVRFEPKFMLDEAVIAVDDGSIATDTWGKCCDHDFSQFSAQIIGYGLKTLRLMKNGLK